MALIFSVPTHEGFKVVVSQAGVREYGLHVVKTSAQFLRHVDVALGHAKQCIVTNCGQDLLLRELAFRVTKGNAASIHSFTTGSFFMFFHAFDDSDDVTQLSGVLSRFGEKLGYGFPVYCFQLLSGTRATTKQ